MINFNFVITVNNKCYKQTKLPISPYKCAPYSELPNNKSTRGGPGIEFIYWISADCPATELRAFSQEFSPIFHELNFDIFTAYKIFLNFEQGG